MLYNQFISSLLQPSDMALSANTYIGKYYTRNKQEEDVK